MSVTEQDRVAARVWWTAGSPETGPPADPSLSAYAEGHAAGRKAESDRFHKELDEVEAAHEEIDDAFLDWLTCDDHEVAHRRGTPCPACVYDAKREARDG